MDEATLDAVCEGNCVVARSLGGVVVAKGDPGRATLSVRATSKGHPPAEAVIPLLFTAEATVRPESGDTNLDYDPCVPDRP